MAKKRNLALFFFSFLLHYLWEDVQAPFFTEAMTNACTMWCSFEDALITTGLFMLASVVARGSTVFFVLSGLLFTAASELVRTQITHTWHYAASMPALFGIGLLPMIQWLLIPYTALVLAKRIVS